jgi:hypothetical protein
MHTQSFNSTMPTINKIDSTGHAAQQPFFTLQAATADAT